MPARDKYSNLLWNFNNYSRKKFYQVDTSGLYYKTFYYLKLHLFIKASALVPGKPFQPSLMLVGKARSLP